ncbi:MAG: glutamine--fructose-6-phosphate transaminase (isomerizing) [candidate division Zixibacteria bacterium CG_4_9_14_3_um_filter_46_8]|nr:MAG: glutamine--fructose-6-phosphate transaminase (isomerizing) [candidate division Zixibacteria bacterium CG_4_9_14_3_um_filter_46_8]
MCGIVGYIGKQEAVPILIEGLKRLEYRGYDSAGIAILENGCLHFEKTAGKIAVLEEQLKGKIFRATTGIAHTRWATHGVPNDLNAHPHLDCTGKIAVVHNGIIENFRGLKGFLEKRGHIFKSDTDTEIICHLVEEYYDGNIVEAVRTAMSQVTGTYGIAVLSLDEPGVVVAARHGSPLVIGQGDGETFVASDLSAILGHTKRVAYLEDMELAKITTDGFEISTIENVPVTRELQEISWTLDMIEKGGYQHFMIKEIFEQPVTIRNALRGRLNFNEGTSRLNGLNLQFDELRHINRIIITACGTSWHAGLIGEYLIEEYARIPVEVEYASEFRYRSPIINDGTVVFAVSQSGETADTLAALREAKRKGATVLGICNVVGSTIARDSDGGVYIHAGPEIGVASTKAFTSQIAVLSLITILLARMRNMSTDEGVRLLEALNNVPEQAEALLEKDKEIKELAAKYSSAENFLYLGRGLNFPVALEGALKLKEISYIHAEGYPAAEMKHGPIALIDDRMPVVVIAVKDAVYDKVISNIEEIRARRGRVIAIATEGDIRIRYLVDDVIYVPHTIPFVSPLINIIPLQLLAYHMAVMRGCPVDQPRNLAKSVTVE